MMPIEELVSITVPRAYLPLVRGFLAGLSAHVSPVEASAQNGPETNNGAGEPDEEWTPAMLDRLVRESHSENMCTILRYLAERPGVWVSTPDLAEAIGTGADSTTVAGTLGAFGRRCYHRYGMNSLPFEGRWDYEQGCKLHRMTAKVATEILRSFESLKRK